MTFAARFATLAIERAAAAANVLVTSVLVGRFFDASAAAAYFFASATTQVLLACWAPAVETAWLRNRSSDEDILGLVNLAETAMVFFAPLALVVTLHYSENTRGHISIVLGAVLGQVSAFFVAYLTPLKYSSPRTYAKLSVAVALGALACKTISAIVAPTSIFSQFALFTELFAIGAVAVVFKLRRPHSYKEGLRTQGKKNAIALLHAGLGIVGFMAAQRIFLWIGAFSLDSNNYAALGLALQILGLFSFVATALNGAMGGELRGQPNRGRKSITQHALLLALAICLIGFLALVAFGDRLLNFIYLDRGLAAFKYLIEAWPSSLATMTTSIGWAHAARQGRSALFGALCFFMSLTAAVGFVCTTSLLIWAMTLLVGALALLYMFMRRDPPC